MIRKFFGYFCTAGIAALVDLGGFWLLNARGMPPLPAAVLSWFFAVIVNYILTSRFIFVRKLTVSDFIRFTLGASIGLLINATITTVLATKFGVYSPLAKLCGIGVAFVFNFLINLLWVFRSKVSKR